MSYTDVPRLGKVDEVANAVCMFVTTGYITGQSLLMYRHLDSRTDCILEQEVSNKYVTKQAILYFLTDSRNSVEMIYNRVFELT